MANAPAGWYDYPGAPGSTRYWTGAAWLAPGAGPAVAAPGLAPQPTGYSPQPTGFSPQPEFRPAPAVTDSHEQVRPVASQYLQPQVAEHRPAPQEDAVTWDVVGVPRTSDAVEVSRAPQTAWQTSAPPGYGRAGDPGAYSSPVYSSEPPLPPYGSSALGRSRRSGWMKVAAVVVAAIVIGFGVRWGLGQYSGGDSSADGSIDVVAPKDWATYSIENPDISYAVDASWQSVPQSGTSVAPVDDFRVIETWASPSADAGGLAALSLSAKPLSAPNSKPSRDDLEKGLDSTKFGLKLLGGGEASFDTVTIQTSRAGDRWAIQTATLTMWGVPLTDYMAFAIIDGNAVLVQLMVPDGVAVNEDDLLATVNSIKAT